MTPTFLFVFVMLLTFSEAYMIFESQTFQGTAIPPHVFFFPSSQLMLLLIQKIQHAHQANQWEHRDRIGLLGVLQEKEVRGLDLGTERATKVAVTLVGRNVEFLEIIALILDLEEPKAVALAKEGEVDSIVEEVEDLVPSLSRVCQLVAIFLPHFSVLRISCF
jgi:hypothetical protein